MPADECNASLYVASQLAPNNTEVLLWYANFQVTSTCVLVLHMCPQILLYVCPHKLAPNNTEVPLIRQLPGSTKCVLVLHTCPHILICMCPLTY